LIVWFGTLGLRGVRVGLFCEDFPTLKDRQISKIKPEFSDDLGVWVATEKEFRLREEWGSGVIACRNLDDPSKYQSSEFAIVAVDELTKNPATVFETLRGSLRWPGIEDTMFWGATNPGGPGHLWVKRYFIDHLYPPELESRSNEFGYVKALPTDNPHNAQSYLRELASLNSKLKRAWLQGDWDVFEGQVFEEWRAEVGGEPCHVLPVFYPPPQWPYAGGLDFGHRAKGWLGFGALGPDEVVITHEFPFQDIHAKQAGIEAAEYMLEQRIPPLEYIAADEEMFYQTGVGPTKAELFQEGLDEILKIASPRLLKITHGRGSRGASLELFHSYLAFQEDPKSGKIPPWWAPKLRFHQRCKYAIDTIPALPYDKNKLEDVDTDAEDHAYDGCRYLLMSRPGYREPEDAYLEPDTHPGLDVDGHRKQPWTEQFAPKAIPDVGFRLPRRGDYRRV
jgi:hypothetical protein